jgi:putative ABC transport system ATP-binding protein
MNTPQPSTPATLPKVQELTKRFISEQGLTCMMVTHNMQHAIDFGNRLLMMDQGRIILDVNGEEKQRLSVSDLVERFHEITRQDFARDDALLDQG